MTDEKAFTFSDITEWLNTKAKTDEEIAQALLQNIEYSKTLTYFDKWGNHKAIMITDIIDFIHRLQDEKKELKNIAEYQQGSNMERWQIIQEKDKTIAEQKAEIERLTEERDKYQEKWQTAYMNELNLQKQVDELKSENTELYKEHTTLIAGSILAKQNIAKDTAKEILIPLVETEKRIDPLKTGIRWSVLKGLCNHYGVNME